MNAVTTAIFVKMKVTVWWTEPTHSAPANPASRKHTRKPAQVPVQHTHVWKTEKLLTKLHKKNNNDKKKEILSTENTKSGLKIESVFLVLIANHSSSVKQVWIHHIIIQQRHYTSDVLCRSTLWFLSQQMWTSASCSGSVLTSVTTLKALTNAAATRASSKWTTPARLTVRFKLQPSLVYFYLAFHNTHFFKVDFRKSWF